MGATRSSPSVELEARVAGRLRAALEPGTRLCVGLSGGRDSVVLLSLLARVAPRLGVSLAALHVNHGLSPHADAWADFCRGLGQSLGIPVEVSRVAVRPAGDGLEAAARKARYRAFAECDADALALAHHAGDQAETLLFRLLRGTGPRGAAAMAESRALARAGRAPLLLLRPMLDVAPQLLADYASECAIEHISDESNADTCFSRNFLRHRVLDLLETRAPGSILRLADAAARFGEAAGLLDDLAAIDAAACADERGLRVSALLALPAARRRNLVCAWLAGEGHHVPSAAWLRELDDQLRAAAPAAQTRVGLGEVELRVWADVLRLVDKAPPAGEECDWIGADCTAWQGGIIRCERRLGGGIALRHLERGSFRLRQRAGGERLKPDAKRPRTSVKNLLQSARVAPWERALLPFLWCGDELVWVGGLGTDVDYLAAPDEPGLVLNWSPTA